MGDHRSQHPFGVEHICSGQQITNIFVLSQNEALRSVMNLNAKKIIEGTKILDDEVIPIEGKSKNNQRININKAILDVWLLLFGGLEIV
jgi:hypothetical protein